MTPEIPLRLPPGDYDELKLVVRHRDNHRCRSCGFRNTLTVHHIVFRSHSGPDETWNLITLCNACHNGIHKDVKDGVFGLVIEQPADANGFVKFTRNWNWVPK